MSRLICVVALCGLLLVATNATAATLQFEALLDGLQETPPVATPGTGFASLTLDNVSGNWTLTGNFVNLIGTANNAHIHGPAPIGTPAGVIVGLTWDPATSGNLTGAGTFTGPQMSDLLAGLYYVNLHSTFRPGGEIRGQLGLVPEPGTFVLFGLGGLVLALTGWRRKRRAS
jgi:hypothetical protein